jgi:hypothetical protein
MFQRSGLLPLSPVAHVDSAMAELGLAFAAAEGNKRPQPAASKGARTGDIGISRGTLKALSLPCARACTNASVQQNSWQRGERVNGLDARVNGAKGPTLPLTQRTRVRGCTGMLMGV